MFATFAHPRLPDLIHMRHFGYVCPPSPVTADLACPTGHNPVPMFDRHSDFLALLDFLFLLKFFMPMTYMPNCDGF